MREEEFYEEEIERNDVYNEEVANEMVDDDELMISEEAFMKGYDEDSDRYPEPDVIKEENKLCPNCGERLKPDIIICPVCRQDLSRAIAL
ncbi:hypothetical protein GOV05_04505 [Candidatus Woesearchaeota archaeon]|nr:hypothetical protein [Candidatus Woesearchaeota archaeon]